MLAITFKASSVIPPLVVSRENFGDHVTRNVNKLILINSTFFMMAAVSQWLM
jgi:hypothetical protein